MWCVNVRGRSWLPYLWCLWKRVQGSRRDQDIFRGMRLSISGSAAVFGSALDGIVKILEIFGVGWLENSSKVLVFSKLKGITTKAKNPSLLVETTTIEKQGAGLHNRTISRNVSCNFWIDREFTGAQNQWGAMVRVDRECDAYVWVRGRWCGVEEAGGGGREEDCSRRLLRPLVGLRRELVSRCSDSWLFRP